MVVLYRHAIEEERKEANGKVEFTKAVFEAVTEQFSAFFDELKLFVNPQMFQQLRELRQLAEHRDEISEENFPVEWERIKSIIPEELVIDNSPIFMGNVFPEVSPTDNEIFSGWVPYSESKE